MYATFLQQLADSKHIHERDDPHWKIIVWIIVIQVTPPRTVDPVAGVPNFFEKDKTLTYVRACAAAV